MGRTFATYWPPGPPGVVLVPLDHGRCRAIRLAARQRRGPALNPDTLALGGNWALQTRLGRFDVMQWLGDAELWDMLSRLLD